MQFGIFHELQHPRPWSEGGEQQLFLNALDQAQLADEIGIQYLWAQEHHFLEEYSHSSSPEVFLAACSQRTRRIRLGYGVALMSPNYNHPARNAERIAALDLVSQGRVEWGTGESSSRLELEGFGVPYTEKRAMWAEGLREAVRMTCSSPYPGHAGKYFNMPVRNIVPKVVQRPHPPLWLACSSRETLKLAARLGMGALTFSFMDHREAAFWVEEYYDVFRRACVPIGRAVNPNVAMLSGFMLDRDGDQARRRGERGLKFFAYGLTHYFRTGVHEPGFTNLWDKFLTEDDFPMAGLGGVGSPEEVGQVFSALEEAGVDQLILLQQAAGYRHDDICASLRLFGDSLLPGFIARHAAREARKQAELAPYIAQAMERADPFEPGVRTALEAYPLMLERAARCDEGGATRRSIGADALWQLHVGGALDNAGER